MSQNRNICLKIMSYKLIWPTYITTDILHELTKALKDGHTIHQRDKAVTMT